MTYSDTLNGFGEVDISGSASVPEYALAEVTVAGPQVRTPFDGSVELVTKVGWFQFGDYLDIGFGSTGYWQDPIWINSLHWQWALPAGQHMSVSWIRYYFSPGTEVFLYIAP
jgi:hypothetical protein